MVNVHHTLVSSSTQSTARASESNEKSEHKLTEEMDATRMFLSSLKKFHTSAAVTT
jgi:hypothetical protein